MLRTEPGFAPGLHPEDLEAKRCGGVWEECVGMAIKPNEGEFVPSKKRAERDARLCFLFLTILDDLYAPRDLKRTLCRHPCWIAPWLSSL